MGSIEDIAYGSLGLAGEVIAANGLLAAGSSAANGFLGLPESFLDFVFGIFNSAS